MRPRKRRSSPRSLPIQRNTSDILMQPFRQIDAVPVSARPLTGVCATEAIHCVVVARDESRRENLGFAAREGGWDVTLCADASSASGHARQRALQMAIVDLTGPANEDDSAFRFLVEQLACNQPDVAAVVRQHRQPARGSLGAALGRLDVLAWRY